MLTFSPSSATAISFRAAELTAGLLFASLLAMPAMAQAHEWPKDPTADTIALRSSSSPAEKKLSFNLLLLSRKARHAPLGDLASSVDTTGVAADGTVAVEVIAYLSPSLMASPVMADIIRRNGAITLSAYISDRLYVRVTQAQLLDLAANPNVLSIRQADSITRPMSIAIIAKPFTVASR